MCPEFLRGQCSVELCPFAHPGVFSTLCVCGGGGGVSVCVNWGNGQVWNDGKIVQTFAGFAEH